MEFNDFLNKYKEDALQVDLKKEQYLAYEILELKKMKLNNVTFECEIDEVIAFCEQAIISTKEILNRVILNEHSKWDINSNPIFLSQMKGYFEYLELYQKAIDKKQQLQPQQIDNKNPDEVKKEFKDFFNSDVNVSVIQSIQKEYKDYKGKKMAHLIYLLHKDFKIINYSLNSRNESRKHFVSLLKGTDFRMAGIDRYFELSDVKLENPKFEIDPDYIDIKEKLLKTIK